MASQAQLENQLKSLDATIADIELRLSRISPRASISTVNELKQRLENAKAEKTRVQASLRSLTTNSSYQSNQGTANTGTTNRSSQSSLEQQLQDVDKRIRDKEAQIANLEKNPRQNAQAIIIAKNELQRLKNEKARLQRELANNTTIRPIVSGGGGDFGGGGAGATWEEPIPVPPVVTPAAPTTTTPPSTTGLAGQVTATRKQATARLEFDTKINEDWRFKIYLAPESNYLYNDPNNLLLQPLNGVGVIFPYNPTVQVTYVANYDQQNVTHSNYKLYFYKDSAVENISITGEFTAQNTQEANYLLAVIHFFKSATKMFYGQDQNPVNGTPPPICYIDGFGTYQFNKHPVLINNFSYSLPNDVDYIRASYPPPVIPNSNVFPEKQNERNVYSKDRLIGLQKGGIESPPQFVRQESGIPTYVPTKIQITLTAYPVISRRDVSSNFSVKEYANGNLLLGRDNTNIGAGIW